MGRGSIVSTHTLSVLVSNRPGVLARVAGLFSRRGFNIESLAVGPTEKPDVSRITLAANVEDPAVLEQLVKQLNKLIEVYKIIELESNAVTREMVLIKVHCPEHVRSQIIDTISLFRAHAVDVGTESVTIEATGADEKIEALIALLTPYGLIELVKSGQVALDRGPKSIDEKRRPALNRKR